MGARILWTLYDLLEVASDPQLEYYDGGIWAAHMLNDRIVVASHVVLLETIHVLRRKTVGGVGSNN